MSLAYISRDQDIDRIAEFDRVSFRNGSYNSVMVFEGYRVAKNDRGFSEVVYDFIESSKLEYPDFPEGITIRSIPRSRLYAGQGQLVLARPVKGDSAAMSVVILPEDGSIYHRKKSILQINGLMK